MSPLLFFRKSPLVHQIRYFSTLPSKLPDNPNPKSNLSARLSFVFDQIDAIDNQTSDKFDALQRIRQWRESRAKNDENKKISIDPDEIKVKLEDPDEKIFNSKKNEVEVVHPWKEWIELMERLGQQSYFDCGMRASEERVAESVGINLSEVMNDVGFDFSRDWTTVRNACMNFGKDRFDILRSLSKKDLHILVGHGCPSMDPKVVFSAKLLRKYTHLDEGDVCSACSLRNSCSRGYILTHKEDEARTLDVMRILLTYGFDHVNGAVENKPLMQMKSVKTVVRKLLHEIVKLSAIPRDPNLPPPVIKKPPPKVKQPPPQPKKRVGRDDVEMKKGDWLCPKCDFMNFAKNTVCLQCDVNRPKRQLQPGEWECPQCNFLNYRRNMACFHCDAKRPPDEFTENQFQARQVAPRMRLDRGPTRAQDISDAWNFDFDDNESDGADVAAFEFADSAKRGNITDIDDLPHVRRTPESFEDDTRITSKIPRARERSTYFSGDNERKPTLHSDRTGFDDFDDEEDDDDDDVDSYELDRSNNSQPSDVSKRNFSEIENSSGSEDFDGFEDDELADHPKLKSSHVAESWNKSGRRGRKSPLSDDDIELDSEDDNDDDMNSGFGSKQRKNHQHSLGRKGIGRQVRDSDLLLDSDSDGEDNSSYSSRNKMRGNKVISDRRGSDFRKSNDFGNARRGEFRSDDRKRNDRRNSFGDQDDDFSYRGSRRRENNRFENFDRLDDGNGRHDRNKGSRREDSRFEHFDKSDDGKRRQDRSNQFSDRPRGSRRDDRGTRGSGCNESRGGGGFRHERDNNFRDRSRSFEDNSSSDRPRGSRRDDRGRCGSGYNESRGDGGFRREKGYNFRDRGRSFEDNSGSDRPRRRVIER